MTRNTLRSTVRRLLVPVLSISFAAPLLAAPDVLAIRVGRAETVSDGPLEHAVILIEDGKIKTIGEDLPIERGIPTMDLSGWTVMPGFVNCYSRAGMDGQAGGGFMPSAHASGELYARQDVYGELLERGVTTLGLYPPGNGIPGQAVAVRPHGDTAEAMTIADEVYLKILLQSDASSKKMLAKGFEEVDEYEEDVQKAREKWEKEQERKKKKKKKKDDDEEQSGDEEDGDASDDVFTPPEPDPDVVPFIRLRAGELAALFRIQKAGDYLHLLDVIEDEESLRWFLRVPLRDDVDLFEVADRIGERGLTVVLDPELTFQPNSRRERNIPAELAAAGAKVALIPLRDNVWGHERWRTDVGLLVGTGLEREDALASMTLNPATVLGLEERIGSLQPGKDANLVFFDGDPLEATSRLQAVMLEGELVYERNDR